MVVTFDLINGVVFGLEHITADEDDVFEYLIVFHCFVLRFCLMVVR